MIIGVLSDTHDNLPKIKKAVKFFNEKRVGFVLHAGDFVSPFAALLLKGLSSPWRGVFGNNDGEHKGLAAASGGRIGPAPLRLRLSGRKIILVHDLHQVRAAASAPDLVVFGHSHKPAVFVQGTTLFVNAGEAGGWLSGKASVALIDLQRLSARIYRI